jgi:outer membrane protein TolC
LNLETAYYNLINSLELLKSAKLAIKHADENLKLVKAKYNLGAASRLELLQAEVFKLRARKEKAGAQILEISAQEALKSILASDCDLYPTDTLAMPLSLEFPPLDSLLVIMTNVNDNIQSAIELENIAKLNLIAAELSILPKISFFYGISLLTDSLIFDFQYYRENYKKNYGINISLPIFEIKTRIFDILNAKKESRLAGFTRKRILLETEKALKITYYSLQEAFENLKLAKREFDAASEASTIAKEQYTLGAISFLDFLAVEQDMFEAGVSYSSALSNFYIQRAQFSHLLGELI